VLFNASRSAKTAPLKLRSMKLQKFIDCAGRLTGVKAPDYLRIGVSRALSFTTQDPECFHVDADGLCCHACTTSRIKQQSENATSHGHRLSGA
jgi:hypothetical protein